MLASSRQRAAMLGIWLLATVTLGFLLLCGVLPAAQAGLHLMVAAGAALAATLSDRRLSTAGTTLRWAVAALFPLAALALGLVPVPRMVAAWVAPGLLAARPDATWFTLATDASSIPGEIATFALVAGFGVLVTVWGVGHRRDAPAMAALTALSALVAMSALGHAYTGAGSMLGLMRPAFVPSPFFAPFVNPNHAAAAMLLGAPIAFAVAFDREQAPWTRGMAACGAVAAIAVIVLVRSNGALVAGGVTLALWLLRGRRLLSVPTVAIASVLAVALQIWGGVNATDRGSALSRAWLWRDTVHMIRDFWLAGTGGGTYEQALRPYRSDLQFQTFAHAHNDPLEWLAETGCLGLIAVIAVVAVLWPRAWREGVRGGALWFGLLALGLHSLVEFPLQIPAIAMAAVAVAAMGFSALTPQRAASPRAVRATLVALCALQLPAAVLQTRQAVVDRAAADVRAFPTEPERAADGARTLDIVHGGSAERLLYAAWSAEAAGDDQTAVAAALEIRDKFPHRPDALRDAAVVLVRFQHFDEATALLQRVQARDPADYRAWIWLARIAHAQGDDALAAERWAGALQRHAPDFDEAYATLPLGLYWLQVFGDADPRYSATLAAKLFQERDLEVALLACEQAAALDPASYGDMLLKSFILVKLGRPLEAEPWVREILSRRPADPYVLEAYATVLGALGRHEEATDAFLRGARAEPRMLRRALTSAEAAGGPPHALELARRLELEGAPEPALGLDIARLHLRADDPSGCVLSIERWKLDSSIVAANATELLARCRAEGR